MDCVQTSPMISDIFIIIINLLLIDIILESNIAEVIIKGLRTVNYQQLTSLVDMTNRPQTSRTGQRFIASLEMQARTTNIHKLIPVVGCFGCRLCYFIPLQTMKFVLLGDMTVGKTCFGFMQHLHQFPGEYIPTIFEQYNITTVQNGVPLDITIMDTASMDDYNFYPRDYRNTDVFIIFYAINNRISFQNLNKWINEAKQYNTSIPFIIVGTKEDLRSDSILTVTINEAEEFSKQNGAVCHILCSALLNFNLNFVVNTAINIAKGENKEFKKCF
ncbi:Rac/Rho-like_protein [Hexamita inflata]|uniref:Rac/Rho-like protein n=1 Tax=Hexamita inflata TaxID=28002 RepID=A0AA86V0N8_9EUKA|nr:Rac/Rho-like protein [Hexamita inflata]